MYKTYRPKGSRVKAVQVTPETASQIASDFMGRVVSENSDSSGQVRFIGVDIPTLDGVKSAPMGGWVVRTDNNALKIMTTEEFDDTYEPVKTTVSTRGVEQ